MGWQREVSDMLQCSSYSVEGVAATPCFFPSQMKPFTPDTPLLGIVDIDFEDTPQKVLFCRDLRILQELEFSPRSHFIYEGVTLKQCFKCVHVHCGDCTVCSVGRLGSRDLSSPVTIIDS